MTIDLAHLEALEKAATPGPWKWVGSKKADEAYLVGSQFRTGLGQCAFDDPAVVMNVDPSYGEYSQSIDINGADAALIVGAVNALPELIAAARERDDYRVGLVNAERRENGYHEAWDVTTARAEQAEKERDELRARLAEAERLLADAVEMSSWYEQGPSLRYEIHAFLARSRETESKLGADASIKERPCCSGPAGKRRGR